MKYVLVLCDGMADYPNAEIGGKTPLMLAHTAGMDALAPYSLIGLAKTVPDGFEPASDVANLGVLGYDVKQCYTGRSPLEALSIGVHLKDGELALRANLVTLSDEQNFEDKRMLDYGAGEISTQEANELIDTLNQAFASDVLRFYTGTSYRHCLVVDGALPQDTLTPPHNITSQRIGGHLAKGPLADALNNMTKQSYDVLCNHPINIKRQKQGKRPANAVWFWGEGTPPHLDDFHAKYQKNGVMISAVDLLKGIGVASGMQVVDVPGATGTLDTDYNAKARYAINALENGADFCMVHIEATDECGHQRDLKGKVQAIENIDEKIISPILSHFASKGEDFKMLVMPDHPTPVSIGKHTSDAVPFMLFDSRQMIAATAACKPIGENMQITFDEQSAKASGVYYADPWQIIDKLFA